MAIHPGILAWEIPVFLTVRFIRQSSTPKDAFEVIDCTTFHLDMGSVKQQLKSKPLESPPF